MIQLTVTLEDDGRILVASPEMEEPYECDSASECAQFIERMIGEEKGETPAEQGAEPAEDYEDAWNKEAASRNQPGLMA